MVEWNKFSKILMDEEMFNFWIPACAGMTVVMVDCAPSPRPSPIKGRENKFALRAQWAGLPPRITAGMTKMLRRLCPFT